MEQSKIEQSKTEQSQKSKFREWMVVQKFTLGRGYSWANVPAIGIIFASSVKQILPGIFDTFFKTVLLAVFGMIVLWCIGWVDKRWRFLHAEQGYTVETNPIMMKGLRGELRPEDLKV